MYAHRTGAAEGARTPINPSNGRVLYRLSYSGSGLIDGVVFPDREGGPIGMSTKRVVARMPSDNPHPENDIRIDTTRI